MRGGLMTQDSERIVALYERHAHAFDRDRVRSLFEKGWLERFRALIPPGGSVLDLGCGMGEPIARYLIEAEHALTGVDSSPSMVALCESRFPDQAWHVADMRTLALARRFDGIVAWDSFFHLTPDDQRRMFPVFGAHAAPKAALMFTSGPAHGESMGVYQGEKLYHASLDPAEYRVLLAQNGFTVQAHIPDDPDCDFHTVWLARRG
jgi:trans-aconitate methyltransferase